MRTFRHSCLALLVGMTVAVSSCGATAATTAARSTTSATATTKAGIGKDPKSHSALVPWIDSPSPVPPVSKPLPTTVPKTDAPPCSPNNLSLVDISVSQIMGAHGLIVQLRNVGLKACLLSGTPEVVAKGSGLPDIKAADRSMLSFGERSDTAPGKTVFLFVEATEACARPGQNPTVYSILDISYPKGGELVLNEIKLPEYCGIAVSPFYSVKPSPQYPSPPTLHLIPSMVLPASVNAGTTLTYEVDVSNPLEKTVDLSPCPIYMEYSSFRTSFLYHLNCSSVHSIPPYGTVRYQMKMAIPADAPIGKASIHWVFFGPGNVANGKLIVKQ